MQSTNKLVINVEYNLNNLEFGYKIEKAFKENNILIEDILSNKYRLQDLYKIPRLGRRSINSIRNEFYKIGFVFEDEDEWTGKDILKKLENKIYKLQIQLANKTAEYERITKSYQQMESKQVLGKIIGSQTL